MPRELFQSPALPSSFTQTGPPSLTIRKRRRSDPPCPPWCKLTPAIVRQGRGSIQYNHCIDRYSMTTTMEVVLPDASGKNHDLACGP